MRGDKELFFEPLIYQTQKWFIYCSRARLPEIQANGFSDISKSLI